MDSRLIQMLVEKAEIVNDIPPWMLPEDTIEELRDIKGLVLAEIAGRDSVAAILRAPGLFDIEAILPTVVYTGTEFGSYTPLMETISSLRYRLKKKGIKFYDPVFLGSPRFWWILCGRFSTVLLKRFGFYSPCLGCHLYLHALRIPLAKRVNSKTIIAGEREFHNHRIKLNQTGIALDAYTELLKRFGVDLLLPLRYEASGNRITEIIGQPWAESGEQLHCVLGKNYRELDGTVIYDDKVLRNFFEGFALKLAQKIIETYLKGQSPDYETIGIKIWEARSY